MRITIIAQSLSESIIAAKALVFATFFLAAGLVVLFGAPGSTQLIGVLALLAADPADDFFTVFFAAAAFVLANALLASILS